MGRVLCSRPVRGSCGVVEGEGEGSWSGGESLGKEGVEGLPARWVGLGIVQIGRGGYGVGVWFGGGVLGRWIACGGRGGGGGGEV